MNRLPIKLMARNTFFRLNPGLILMLLFTAGCQSVPSSPSLVPGDAAAPSQVTPQQALQTARVYSEHPWRPFARNIKHGCDPKGIQVDTPDTSYRPENGRNGWWVPGEVNQGIPYKWGGFDDLASFDAAIAKGYAGGDVSTPAKRRGDNAAVSCYAAGLDCSGFVSRCLNLPTVYDSAHLPDICEPLASPQDLRPGDLLNIPSQHVMLVAGWVDRSRTEIYYYETGGVPWKPALKVSPLYKVMALGYVPMRYRGMAREMRPSGKEVLVRSVRAKAMVVPEPVVGEP